MNREIKFMAWHKSLKTMFFVKIITMTVKGVFACFLTDEISSCDVNPNEIDLIQFTGYKDKRKREIYGGEADGHIVYYSISETQHYKGVVKWSQKRGGFVIDYFWHKQDRFGNPNGDFYEKGFEANWHGCHGFDDGIYDLEILGNTFENLELLKDE